MIRRARDAVLELEWGAESDTGLRRQRNEDSFLVLPRLFVVADGMGGHERGDVASAMATTVLEEMEQTLPENREQSDILDAVHHANRLILDAAGDDALRPMGTTVCGLAVIGTEQTAPLMVFNVGDSRVYRLRDRDLGQLTHDHSVVQELIDRGELSPAHAESHPERNVITRSLGSDEPLEIDWWMLDARWHDRFLLCSDGLTKELDQEQIRAALSSHRSALETANSLVAQALDAGGRDNITVIIVDVTNTGSDPSNDDDTNPRFGLTGDNGDDTNPRFAITGDTQDDTNPRAAGPYLPI